MLRHPVAVLVIVAMLVAVFGWYVRDFGLDASADSLTLEHDEALEYYQSVRARYGSDAYLIVTFTPPGDLFAAPVRRTLGNLRDELAAIPQVASVVTMLDVPLIASPPLSFGDLPEGINYLSEPTTDVRLARTELLHSPLYRNYIISPDGRTTALRVDLREDAACIELRERRDALRERQFSAELSAAEAARLDAAETAFDACRRQSLERERQTIASVRRVLGDYRSKASISLGGVPMIVADSIDFIRHDMLVFGFAVIAFLIVILAVAFRKLRWVVLPLVTCLATCVITVGLLGMLQWRVTVVSSNFLSLILILCLALTLHIIVRYREQHALRPEASQAELVGTTVRRIVIPCFFTALTTMVAFGSLVVSGIRPVIDFGWMMVIGTAIGFLLAFTLLPASMLLLRPGEPRERRDFTAAVTQFFARIVARHGSAVVVLFALLGTAAIVGMTRLTVENRFIDYYRENTEIYRGMELIDRELGGTTPLDVIIDAPPAADEAGDDDAEFDDIYADGAGGEAGITATSYWFNSRRLREVMAIHDHLDALPQTGKVISIATAARMLGQVDDSIVGDNLALSIVYSKLPPAVVAALIDPYLSAGGDQLRFSIRVFESDPALHRAKLLHTIRRDLHEEFGLAAEQVHLSGMLVLYNNMLESLFESQILTLGAV
ncbi:MAG TPA: MMPL family transporter, partial [Woeseiaceae bacterium]|nr:MMPL family transporter [Woeseiaceae bacterium]